MLLDDDLRRRLPGIGSQCDDPDPWVYARFHLPGTDRAWYVIEGEQHGDDYLFFGFVVHLTDFARFPLTELEAIRAERDSAFEEGQLTEVVPTPDF